MIFTAFQNANLTIYRHESCILKTNYSPYIGIIINLDLRHGRIFFSTSAATWFRNVRAGAICHIAGCRGGFGGGGPGQFKRYELKELTRGGQ